MVCVWVISGIGCQGGAIDRNPIEIRYTIPPRKFFLLKHLVNFFIFLIGYNLAVRSTGDLQRPGEVRRGL